MKTINFFLLIPVILFSVSLSAKDVLPNRSLLGLWKYQSAQSHIHFVTTSGLVVFTDADQSTTLAYLASTPAYGEYMTFKRANGKGDRIYGFSSLKFITNDLIEVSFKRKSNGKISTYKLKRQTRSNPVFKNASFYSWYSDKQNLRYSLTGTWVTTTEVLSIYEDGTWFSHYPSRGEKYGGFLGYKKDHYRSLKLYYGPNSKSEYQMRFISQHELRMVNKEGIVITYYRRSWTPGATVELAPSASSLLFNFLGKVLFDDAPPSGESRFDRNLRDAQRAKENAYEERRRNGGY